MDRLSVVVPHGLSSTVPTSDCGIVGVAHAGDGDLTHLPAVDGPRSSPVDAEAFMAVIITSSMDLDIAAAAFFA